MTQFAKVSEHWENCHLTLNIDLWTWNLDHPLNAVNCVMTPEEQTRAARFVQQIHQDRFANGRNRLRHILAGYLDKPPQDLQFSYGANGKPELAGLLRFNLSHSENHAALAVVNSLDNDAEIGLDIQQYRPVEADVAKRFFSTTEQAELAQLPSAQWNDGFYRCWTRKEAIVKALGTGLTLELDSFDVTLTPHAPVRLTRFATDPTITNALSLHHFDLAPDLVGAIAVFSHGRPVKITHRRLPVEK
nr:4'-phosphopantetheinyl transferase superfamily protein [Amylibacter sp.]